MSRLIASGSSRRRTHLATGVVAALAVCSGQVAEAAVDDWPHFTHRVGTSGADVLKAGAGPAWIEAGAGDDSLLGGAGPDYLSGNAGGDTLEGGPGDDTLRGGLGADSLSGGPGADWLSGDRGDDTLTGGAGADHFVLSVDGGHDVVTDFSSAEGDRIALPAGVAFTLAAGPRGALIRLETGDEMLLAGVAPAALGDWRETANAPAPPSAEALAAPAGARPTAVERIPDRSALLLALTATGILAALAWMIRGRRRRSG